MVATPIAAPVEYINAGTTKTYILFALAVVGSPTRSELNAGTDVTRALAESAGWKVESDQVDAPNMDDVFTPTISGRTKVADSSLTLYCDVTGADIRALLPRGTNCWVIWLDGGDVSGRKCSIFPSRVSSLGMVREVKGDNPATIEVAFAITATPQENVTIP
jgi:hypothetical protein